VKETYSFPHLDAHQTQRAPTTDWESDLADAIEAAFAKGHQSLDELVAALNRSRMRPRAGGLWTPENFTALMRELGARP
jgi:hypothetical protein